MKKLFGMLFCILILSAPSFADKLSYEIDPVATAKAPWKVGEKIVKEGRCVFASGGIEYYREFLGVMQSDLVLVRDFYLSGEKLSDPFLMSISNTKEFTDGLCPQNIEGHYSIWYKNGQKQVDANFKNGKLEGLVTHWYENGQKQSKVNFKNNKEQGLVTYWHENGQKSLEGSYKNQERVGIWREWDEKGNLIKEKDYSIPKD